MPHPFPFAPPSFYQGYAIDAEESAFPGLRAELIAAHVPVLGVSGDVLLDVSGFGRDCVLTDMDPNADWILGSESKIPGYVLDFDGTDGHALGPNGVFFGLSSLSIAVWVKFDALSGVDGIVNQWRTGATIILFRMNGSNLQFFTFTSGQVGGTIASLSTNTLYFIVAVYDGSEMRVYINAVLDNTTFSQSGILGSGSGDGPYIIGGGDTGSEGNLDGQVFQVLTYGRVLTVSEIDVLYAQPFAPWMFQPRAVTLLSAAVTVAVSGTTTTTIDEDDITTVAQTTILTLTGDTWVAAGATFDAQRIPIRNGVTSAQVEATGWNAEVRDTALAAAVVRDSDTQVTITWATAQTTNYDITAQETIEVTVPPAALVTSIISVVGAPTFTVDFVPAVTFGQGQVTGGALVTGQGFSVALGAGAATGAVAVAGQGRALAFGQGAATGAAAVHGEAFALAFGRGAVTGTAVILGQGASLALSTGMVNAAGSLNALSALVTIILGRGVVLAGVDGGEPIQLGTIDGVATVAGASRSDFRGAGLAVGAVVLDGVGRAKWAVEGDTDAAAVLAGVGQSEAFTEGTIAASAVVDAVGVARKLGTGGV